MMSQFEVIAGTLLVADASRYNFWWGFRRPLRRLA